MDQHSFSSPRRADHNTSISSPYRYERHSNSTYLSPTKSQSVDRRALRDTRVIADLQVEKEIVDRRCNDLSKTNSALQAEINSLVGKLQAKSSRIMELNSQNQLMQQRLGSSEAEIISLNKDIKVVSEKNRDLTDRTRELEQAGRELNNMSIESTMRERDLENQLQSKTKELQLREEVLERNRQNAELLERKIEDLRTSTQQSISTRDEIIRAQSEEHQRRDEANDMERRALETQLQTKEEQLTNELRERDAVIERYMARIKKQAAQLDQMARGIQGLQTQRSQAQVREDELSRMLVEQKERSAQLQERLKQQGDEHEALVRQLQSQLVSYETKTRALTVDSANKEKDIEALVNAQRAQLKAHQMHQEEWGEKLLRQEIIHEKEKDALALQLQCRKCPGLKLTIKRQKAKLKNADEHIKLLTLSLPRRVHKTLPHWTP